MTDIKGDLTLNSVSGAVRIANAGRIAARSRSPGTSRSPTPQIDGALEAQSVSGNVLVRRVSARRIDLGTVSGSVIIQDVQSRAGRRPFGQRQRRVRRAAGQERALRAQLAFGQRRIVVGGGGTGFELEANSFSGSVRSDLPITMQGGDRSERGGAARSAASTATAARSSTSRPSRAASSFRSGNPHRPVWIHDASDPGCPAHQAFSGRKQPGRAGPNWHSPCSFSRASNPRPVPV